MTDAVVTIRLFASLRDLVGEARVEVPADDVRCVRMAFDALARRFPQAEPFRAVARVAVNARYASPDDPVGPGDEVAIITPVSGG